MRDMTHWYEGHDSFIRETWLTADLEALVTWIVHMRDMTHFYEGHDSFIRGTWLIHVREDTTHSYEGQDSFIWGTWLMHLRDWTRGLGSTSRARGMRSVSKRHPRIWKWPTKRLVHVWRHVKRTRVYSISYTSANLEIWISHSNGWVMSHVWMKQIARMSESHA